MTPVALVAGTALLLLAGAAQSAQRTAPSNTSPPTISGGTAIDSEQTASPGSWSGSDPKSYVYQWQRCDTNGNNCANFGEARAKNTYNTDVVDSNHRLRVLVTATNSDGSASATSAPTAVIGEGSPLNTSPADGLRDAQRGGDLDGDARHVDGPGPDLVHLRMAPLQAPGRHRLRTRLLGRADARAHEPRRRSHG